jgi:hypothetical protein
MGAAGAAIANALFDATGVRLRQYPLTPERVRAALAARINDDVGSPARRPHDTERPAVSVSPLR